MKPTMPPAEASTPERLFTRAFVTVFASGLVFFVAGGLLLPVSPRFAIGPIGADALGFGIAMGMFALASLAARPVVGWLADSVGRRPLLVGGALLTTAGLVLHLGVTTLVPFVAARAILGVGEACFLVAGLSSAGDLAPPRRTGEALSLMSLSIYGGIAAGPVLGEAVLAAGGYPAVWITAAGLTGLSAALAALAPETRPSRPPGAAARRGRLFHPAGVFPGLLVLCLTWGMAGFLTFVALHATALGLDGAGAALLVYGVVVILLRLLGARLPDRVGSARLAGSALVCSAVGLLLIGVLPGLGGLLAGTAVFAVGIALGVPAMIALAMSRAPATERGSVVGTTSVFLDLAFGLAPVALAPLAALAGYPATFVASAVVAVAGAALLIARRASLAPTEPSAEGSAG